MIESKESITAKLCAFARAYHSREAKDKIFDDYLAYDILGDHEYNRIYDFIKHDFDFDNEVLTDDETKYIISEYIAPIPLARIHFAEVRLERFIKENEDVQVVICGAGSDTFSFRNKLKNIQIYEIDHSDTQSYKLDKINTLGWQMPGNVRFVAVDFAKEKMIDKLIAAGFNKYKKTFFSILGVSYYLSLPIFSKTLEQITDLSTLGSVLVFDYPRMGDHFPERVYKLEDLTDYLGETMSGGFKYEDVSRALYRLGYQIDTYMSAADVQKYYFDGREDKLRAFENVDMVSAKYTAGYSFE